MSIQALAEVLDSMIQVHQELMELAAQKQKIIVQNDIEALTRISAKEQKAIKYVEELQEGLHLAMSEYLASRGIIPAAPIKVSDLIKLIFRIEDRKLVMERQIELLDIIERLKRQNELNQKLMHEALHFIEFSLDLIAGHKEDSMLYQHPNHTGQPSYRNSIFDTKA